MSHLFPIAFLDAPRVLNASVTNIPGAAGLPVQVIADSGTRAAHAIDFLDSSGDYIGVYTGSIGSETLRCIIGGGVVNRAYVVIAAHSRVSLRSMITAPITNGNITLTLMGMGLP